MLFTFLKESYLQVILGLPSMKLYTSKAERMTKVTDIKGIGLALIPSVTDMHILRQYWDIVSMSDDFRILLLLLAWFFEFLEM